MKSNKFLAALVREAEEAGERNNKRVAKYLGDYLREKLRMIPPSQRDLDAFADKLDIILLAGIHEFERGKDDT